MAWIAHRPGNAGHFHPHQLTKTAVEVYLASLEHINKKCIFCSFCRFVRGLAGVLVNWTSHSLLFRRRTMPCPAYAISASRQAICSLDH